MKKNKIVYTALVGDNTNAGHKKQLTKPSNMEKL